MRAFIAIRLCDDIVRELIKAQDELKIYDKYANYTRRENLHLTLAFIGETDRADDIASIMESSVGAPFELSISKCGSFGKDLWWVGAENTPPLSALAKRIRKALLENGFDIDTKPFTPHITIARQVKNADGVKLNIKKKTMTTSEICLMKSERINGKLVYTTVKRVELKSI